MFTVQSKTPSVNHLYGQSKFGTRYMKPEAKALKLEIIESIREQAKRQKFVLNDWTERLLTVTVTVTEDWFTIKNTAKKKDIANREKFLIDSVFEALGLDDKHIWKHTMIKKTDPNPYRFGSNIEINYWRPKCK